MLLLPATPDVIAGVVETAEAAPDELSIIANVMPAPPMPFVPASVHGQLVMMILLCYAGDAEAGARAVAPLRALATPIADMVRPMRYPEIYPPDDPSYHPKAIGRDAVHRHASIAARQRRSSITCSDPTQVCAWRSCECSAARCPRVRRGDGLRASRHGRILVNVAAFYDGPEDRPSRESWTEAFAAALDQGRQRRLCRLRRRRR